MGWITLIGLATRVGGCMELLDLLTYYLVRYYALILVAVFAGSFMANAAMELGVARALSKPFTPILRAAGIPDELSAVLALSLIDTRAAHAALSAHYRRGELDERQVVACFLLMTPLGAVPMLARHYAPIAYAALGPYPATLYLALALTPLAARAIVGVAYSRRLRWEGVRVAIGPRGVGRRGGLRDALRMAARLTRDVAVRLAVVTAALVAMTLMGVYELLGVAIAPLTSKVGLSAAGASIVAVRAVSPSIGLLVAGDMLRRGVIGLRELLVSLLMGSLLFALTSDYPRHAFPFYASVYPVKLAAKLTAIGLAIYSATAAALIAALILAP